MGRVDSAAPSAAGAAPASSAFKQVRRFIVASFEKLDFERLPMWCGCTSVIVLSCAPYPRPSRESVAQRPGVHYNFAK